MTSELIMLPVSFGQELLWSIERAAPGRSTYNVPRTWRLAGKLDRAALQRALDGLVARHEILRTTYAVRDDEPVQVIHPARPLNVTFVDLSESEPAEALAAAEGRTRAAAAVPFDLTRDLPFRVTILQLAPDEHVLHIDSHHIASDGGSRDIIVRELGELYRAAASDTAAQLPELPIQYGDYAEWERGHLAGERLERLLTYWREELAGAALTLDLPADVPQAPDNNGEATTRALVLDAPFVDALKNFARCHDATLYMLLLAGYQALLQRYSGQSDILVGSPVAGRSQPETEGLIGYFASMVVQRARFGDDPTMTQLLAQVRASSIGAFDHREMPFEKLVLELQAGADFRRSPIFQAVFTALESDEGGSLRIGDLEASQLGNPVVTTKFDLTLFMRERVDGVTLSLRVRSSLWTPETIERFLRQLHVLLASAIAAPGERVSQLPIFDAGELREFAAWNATTLDDGAAPSLDALIAATAARVPGRTALVAGDTSLTYAQLDAHASRLAAALRFRGVVAGSRVGVLLDRSVEAIVAVTAVLRTGAAYVPLSPHAPAVRLAQQMSECGADVAVTIAQHALLLPASVSAIVVDRDALPVAGDDERAHSRASSGDVAYVLFTSGSTGVPKGVAVTHANIVHYTRAIARVLADLAPGEPGDGFARLDGWHFGMVTTLAADLGYTSLFPALCAGGTVHLIARETATDPQRFAEYAALRPLDVLKITPGHFRALLPERAASVLPRRWLVLGGETLRFELANRLAAASACRILNHYGPTETTVGACTFEVTPQTLTAARDAGARTVPIGRPLARVRCDVLDVRGQLVPLGVAGELFVAGAGVARGYINVAATSAQPFVDGDALGRRYRTGDRVRRLRDGTLEFLGRLDGQVKVRGHRVEIGELEAALAGFPGVVQTAARAWTDATGTSLAAFVVAPSLAARADAPSALQKFLAERLPEYMLPRSIAFLDALPLGPSGKLDRSALPLRDDAPSAAERTVPRTEVEAAIVDIWSQAMRRDAATLGVHDSFIELGGHSLIAIRILGSIKRRFGVRLALRALFDAPTVAELARVIEREQRADSPAEPSLVRTARAVYRRPAADANGRATP